MLKRIIIFDGLDCIGKTSVITELEKCLEESGFHVYTFHLTRTRQIKGILFSI